MAEQTSFSLSRIYRALGVRTGILPPFDTEAFAPVAIVADFSRSYAPEQIEGRAVMLETTPSLAPHLYVNHLIEVRSAGGIIVEALEIETDQANAQCYFKRRQTRPWTGISLNTQRVDVGGLSTRSDVEGAWNVVLLGTPSCVHASPLVVPTERMYVPAGWYFEWGSYQPIAPVAHTLRYSIVWREIPEILGTP